MKRCVAAVLSLALFSGCGEGEKPAKPASRSVPEKDLMAPFVLAEKPEGAAALKEVLAGTGSKEEVAVRGVVGDFFPGRAAFRLVDPSVLKEGAEIPWAMC